MFGKTRQAYYDRLKHQSSTMLREDIVLILVKEIREDFPRMGARKLLIKMHDDLQKINFSIGRDAFISLLSANNLLIHCKRSGTKTTYSNHRFRLYPNKIKGIDITTPNQVWVSDITYIRIGMGFIYLFLITDAYSRKIVGWNLSSTLSANNAIKALEMALRTLPKGCKLIHHSDRGTQYCCTEYIKLLNKNNVNISMTENGDPLENAIAERVNGILKTEWINDKYFDSFKTTNTFIERIIYLYNFERPHQSISNLTPEQVHTTGIEVERNWKNYWQKRDCNVEIIT